MSRRRLSRRQFVAATALSSAALISAPYLRTARAAGKLTIGLWDHWVPGANKTSTDVINEWAAKEKVEVQIDYITSQGNKLLLTQPRKPKPSPATTFSPPAVLAAAGFRGLAGAHERYHGADRSAEWRCERHG